MNEMCVNAEIECPDILPIPEDGLVVITGMPATTTTVVETYEGQVELSSPLVEETTELAFTGAETGLLIWLGIMAVCIGQFMRKVSDLRD